MTRAERIFRWRVPIFVLLYLLGFFAPWDFRRGNHGTLWLAASTLLARSGWIGLAAATLLVTIAALACLSLGALLRVWGTAYLGSSVMSGRAMQGDALVAAGPYRYVRNPLYLGSWLLGLGVSVLMPPGGAAFFLLAFSAFVLLLVSAEERFLASRQGESYRQYLRAVPRFLLLKKPAVAPLSMSPQSMSPQWGQALLAEVYSVTITLCFAALAWRYDARILIRCVLICYGLSLVARALLRPSATDGTAN
ncbi:MAG: isoprenylcysteine carboxylmethyltransferase family protein [Acidobacteriaceae bacterium]